MFKSMSDKSTIKMMRDKLGRADLWIYFLLIAGFGVVLGGCQYYHAQPAGMGSERSIKARQDFMDGNYELARKQFSSLARHPSDTNAQEAGQYGLRCVEMILATDVNTYFKTLDSLLHQFGKKEYIRLHSAEMFFKALAHGKELMIMASKKASNLLSYLETDNKTLRTEIRILQEQIKTLKHQISSLESIDQDLQEKRKNQ